MALRITRASLVLLLLPILADCGRSDKGNIQARKMTAAERTANRRARQIGGTSAGSRVVAEEVKADSAAPFERLSGYVVRGSDESSFLRCGSTTVHYLRLSPMAAAKVVQQYRFRSPKPLHPVYFAFKARIVKDSVQVGENLYTSSVEVVEMLDGRDERPDCPPPSYGSLVARARAVRGTRASGGDVP